MKRVKRLVHGVYVRLDDVCYTKLTKLITDKVTLADIIRGILSSHDITKLDDITKCVNPDDCFVCNENAISKTRRLWVDVELQSSIGRDLTHDEKNTCFACIDRKGDAFYSKFVARHSGKIVYDESDPFNIQEVIDFMER